jgi:SAM-dependent methyltransferase
MVCAEDKSIALGHPSYVWRWGQERRLRLVQRRVGLDGKRVLDVGCGIGAYMSQFLRFTPQVYGVDLDQERVCRAREQTPRALVAAAEHLPFREESFDVIFLHEVIEHVKDDSQCVREASRVLRQGGHMVIYAPNRLYPLETHGFYLGRRYVFRLLPLVNYLPYPLRRCLVPHVRCYLARDLRRLFRGLPTRLVYRGYVYPGFDSISARRPWLGRLLRATCCLLENTPLRIFGLSHFLVARKTG